LVVCFPLGRLGRIESGRVLELLFHMNFIQEYEQVTPAPIPSITETGS
jgi:hypothetical protein